MRTIKHPVYEYKELDTHSWGFCFHDRCFDLAKYYVGHKEDNLWFCSKHIEEALLKYEQHITV